MIGQTNKQTNRDYNFIYRFWNRNEWFYQSSFLSGPFRILPLCLDPNSFLDNAGKNGTRGTRAFFGDRLRKFFNIDMQYVVLISANSETNKSF